MNQGGGGGREAGEKFTWRCHRVNNNGDSGQGMMQYLHEGLISISDKTVSPSENVHKMIMGGCTCLFFVGLVLLLWIAVHQQEPVYRLPNEI